MNRFGMFRWFLILLLASGCTRSCTKTQEDMTPSQVVETFLDVALNMSKASEKPYLVALSTGNMRRAIENATEKEIQDTYINKNYKIINFGVVEEDTKSPRRIDVTFELKFKDLGTLSEKIAENEAATITTENTVRLDKKGKIWLISETLGKKSTIDFPLSSADTIYAD